jgi:hypothetical protein
VTCPHCTNGYIVDFNLRKKCETCGGTGNAPESPTSYVYVSDMNPAEESRVAQVEVDCLVYGFTTALALAKARTSN